MLKKESKENRNIENRSPRKNVPQNKNVTQNKSIAQNKKVQQNKSIPQNKKLEKKKLKEEKKLKRKKSKGWKIFRLILIIAIIALIIFAGIFTYKTIKNGGGLQGIIATAMGHDEYTLKDLDPITFLVLGISGCDEEYKLADTIMICSYDPKEQKASILSIPRDTYVGKNKTKASANYKINAVYRNGENIDGMIESLEDITGLEIPNYLIIDTEALVELVDAIGGVEYDVPIDMLYDDPTQDLHINLKAGYQKLNGEQAEWLVRFRHNNDGTTYSLEYGDNDLGRMKTQRQFIETTLKQTMKPENILKLNKILKIGYNNIQTNMTFETIKDYIPYAVNFKTENLKTGTLPGVPEQANGIWIYTVNKKETLKVIDELFGDEEQEGIDENQNTITTTTTTKPKTTTSTSIDTKEKKETKDKQELQIEILNGSGKTANLKKAVDTLKENGYNVVKTGNNKTTSKTSIINRTNQSTTVTNEIREILKAGVATQKSNNSKVDYTIILGKDYK